MTKHKSIHMLFYEYLQNELSAADRRFVDVHLAHCQSCRAELESLRSLLKKAPRPSRAPSDEVPVGYWNAFAQRVEERIKTQERAGHSESPRSVLERLEQFVVLRPRLALAYGGATIVVLASLLVWRWAERDPRSSLEFADESASLQHISLDERTRTYLDRSKILLLGIVNLEAEPDLPQAVDLNRYRAVSHQLVQEARDLRVELDDPQHLRLRQLISDLEIILLQIANLESQEDLPAIELVKNGVDRKGIFLKINLEKMRMVEQANSTETNQGI